MFKCPCKQFLDPTCDSSQTCHWDRPICFPQKHGQRNSEVKEIYIFGGKYAFFIDRHKCKNIVRVQLLRVVLSITSGFFKKLQQSAIFMTIQPPACKFTKNRNLQNRFLVKHFWGSSPGTLLDFLYILWVINVP